MEGLLLHATLDILRARLPARTLSWRALDAHTMVLPLVPSRALWIHVRPGAPWLEVREDQVPASGTGADPFARLLAARAVGPLQAAEQPALDRVVRLRFGADEGFVHAAPVTLVAELTGRNANLVLLDEEDVVLGARREVGAKDNRRRQIRPGIRYVGPPPYDKLDPRHADRAALAEALRGRALSEVRQRVDGLGAELARVLASEAGLEPEAELEGSALERALDALENLVRDPLGLHARHAGAGDVRRAREVKRRRDRERRATDAVRRARDLARKRVRDADHAMRAADDADALRHEADLLLAYAHRVPSGAERVELPDFEGGTAALSLDPACDAAGNAEARYERARKKERRAERALQEQARWETRAKALDAQLEGLGNASDEALEAVLREHTPRSKGSAHGRRPPGARFEGPHGFTVVVGRSAKENEAVTFDVARSRDLWLHAQGWHGAHVVILAGGREVPFDTVLFAAELAAGHSKASGGDNVPVDYTQRKNVWKVKGAPRGTVRFTQQKTVFVTPRRGAERRAADAAAGGVDSPP